MTSVIYLAFTAGYAPTSGSDAIRVELAGEAIRLARLLRVLLPRPELDALLALMLLAALPARRPHGPSRASWSCCRTRTGRDGGTTRSPRD